MNKYIFITDEGMTYQPDSDSIEPDCENSQVIGFSNGANEKEAFDKLLKQNTYLKDTNFCEIYCYQVKEDEPQFFYLK